MNTWVPVNNNVIVSWPFQADKEYIENFKENIVISDRNTTPSWYNETTRFLDVTSINPTPDIGFYKEGENWIDGNPNLSTNTRNIPADGKTPAVITFTQKGPNTPTKVTFVVNEAATVEPVSADGIATCEIVSTNPGDVITVKVNGLTETVKVDLNG